MALALPLVVGLVAVLNRSWHPTGDYAHTGLAIRDVTNHPPLIGVAGRFGPFDNQHAHPGPAMAYLLWPITAVLGGSGSALLVSTTVLHLAALVASVLVARRIGGAALAVIVGAMALLLVRALGAQFFLTPWNPWMPVAAFLLFLVLVVGVVAGNPRYLPWAGFVGTVAAQTHISYMVLVYGILVAVGLFAVEHWRRVRAAEQSPPWARGIVCSLGVLAVMWALPLWDQLRQTRNFSWIVGRFSHPCDPRWWGTECAQPVGLSAAAKAMATELSLSGAWISGARHDPVTARPQVLLLLATIAAVLAAGLVAWRRRDRVSLSLLTVAFGAVLLGLFSTARILGDFYDYVIRWTWPMAALCAAAVLYTLTRSLDLRRYRRPLLLAAGVAVASLSLAATVSAWSVDPPYESDSRSVGALSAQVTDKLSQDTSYLLRWHDPAGLGGIGFGLMLELERHGFSVGTDSWTRFAVGQHRVVAPEQADAVLYIVVGEPSIEEFAARSDDELLASFDPRSAANKARSDAARAQIDKGLAELGRSDLLEQIDNQFGNAALIAAGSELPEALNKAISIYTDLRLPVALFQVPPDAPGFVP